MSEEIKKEVAKTDAEEAVVEAEIEPEITEEEEPIGNIKISVDVVTTIAGIAASEIEGVSCMYTSFVDGVAQRLGAK
ncbi:MAG: Asp23/Gls24 family envelope stress response protein, partial [Clostridia bacterium]|nr:Asp23/Gls24 family envelope stress response protein [Clostridia bacterium]